MRKWWLLLLALLVVGGGYFGFKFYKNQSAPVNNEVKAEDENVKREKVKISDKEVNKSIETNVEVDKAWEFSFGYPLKPDTVNSTNITVKDKNNKPVQTTINLTNDNKTINILPPSGGYSKGETYNLHIENGISYSDGEPVSKPYDLTFEVDRDEIEKATLNKNLVIATKEQINSIDGDVINIDKSIKKDLKKDDIIVIPTESSPDGHAVKVVSVKSNSNSYTVTTTQALFTEIYQDLDINKDYEIRPEDIELEEGIEGVAINPISQAESNTMIASQGVTSKEKKEQDEELKEMTRWAKEGKEYSLPKVSTSYTKSKGFEVKLDGLQVAKKNQNLALSGSMLVLKPKVDTDIKIKWFKLKKMKVTTQTHTEQEISLKLLGKGKGFENQNLKLETDKKKLEKLSKLAKKIKIGNFKVPTNVPGISIQGGLYIKVKAGIDGEVKLVSTFEFDSTRGFIYEDGKSRPIDIMKPTTDISFDGKGVATVAAGPLLQVRVDGYDTVAAGLEGYWSPKIEGQILAGADVNKQYVCAVLNNGTTKGFNFFIDLSIPFSNKEHRILESSIGPVDKVKDKMDTCEAYKGIEPSVKTLKLHSGEEKNINVVADYLNLISSEHKKVKIKDYKVLDTSVSNEEVVKIKKNKKSLNIKALENPKSEKTSITIKYKAESKVWMKKVTKKVTIPVEITDYDEIAKKAAESEAQEQAKLGSLKGEWSLVNDFGGSTLNILDVKNNRLKFEINASSGGHATGYEGTTAKIKNDEALYVDKDTDCYINFVVDKKDTITIYESPECNLNNVSIEGDYKKGQQPQPEQKSLSELTNGEISEERDEAIRNLVGEDYDIFVTNTQQYVVDGEEDVDAFGSTVITTAVPGLYKYNEAIIMLTTPGDLFLATIVDGEKVRFYTDNELYQDKLPLTIQNWMSRFSDYPVEYRYKPITNQ